MQSINFSTRTLRKIESASRFSVLRVFKRDYENYEGVAPINIYLLRLLFTLVVIFVIPDSWTHILNHTGPWEPVDAAAWSMWASYSVISIIGIFRPLKLLPIVLFEIVYKIAWLLVVAYPLWTKGQLSGSPAEGMAGAFLWVILPVVAMPWGYFFRTYLWRKRERSSPLK
jgi:hypothetical protein